MQNLGERVVNTNSRKLILEHAAYWARRLELEAQKKPA